MNIVFLKRIGNFLFPDWSLDVLKALVSKELYGLEIIDVVNKKTTKKRKIGFGSLYPTLRRLEKDGLISSRFEEEKRIGRGGARRRYYRLTLAGNMFVVLSLSLTETSALVK